jgi:RNA polymerase sigma-70 factor (ECF subfamily)
VADEVLEAGLVERARAGDHAAFATLVVHYQQPLGGYLARLTGDHEVAADLVQEVFLRAYCALGATRPGLLVRPWLYRIATHLAYDYLRRRRRLAWLPLEAAEPRAVHDPMADLAEHELVQQALASLRPAERAVLLLCGLEGLPYTEAALALGGHSPDAVRKRFGRAKEHFRLVYLALGGASPPEAA